MERVDRQGAYARLGGKLYPGAVQPQKMSVAGAEGYSDNTCAMRELRLLLTISPRPAQVRSGHERAAFIRILGTVRMGGAVKKERSGTEAASEIGRSIA